MNDPKLAKAIELIQQHEAAKNACLAFLKEEGVFGCDPIALKLWISDRLTQLPKTEPQS